MGYTHYWRRPEEIGRLAFNNIVGDFKRLVPVLERAGVKLAGPAGEGKPVVSRDLVAFNGPVNCGHPADHELVIPWPAPDAGGVFATDPVAGTWFAGHLVATRSCPGDCSYESFVFPRLRKPWGEWDRSDENGLFFDFCKTAFRPYDLAVTAFLLVAKHHLGDFIRVSTDGEDAHWSDAKLLCQMELGWGLEYRVTDGALASRGPTRHPYQGGDLAGRGGGLR